MNTLSRNRRSSYRWLSLFGLTGAIVLVLSTAGASWVLHGQAGDPSGTAARSEAETAPMVVCLGHVDVENGVTYPYPSSPGRVKEVLVNEGDTVKAGSVLFRMDDTVARAQVQEAEAAVKGAEAQLAQARNGTARHRLLAGAQQRACDAMKHELASAKLIAERKNQLKGNEGGMVSKEEAKAADEQVLKVQAAVEAEEKKLEELMLQAPDIESKIVQAEQDLAYKKALLTKAHYALDECSIKAKMDGSVLRLALQPSDLLGPDPKLPPLIFCPATPRIIRAEVEQEWASRVEKGQRAVIRDVEMGSNGPSWTGKVVRVADWLAHRRSILPDPSQFFDVRTLECVIQVDPGQAPLRIGQRVRVSLSKS